MLLFLPTGASVDGSGRSSVIIDNVTVNDGGTYVCIAENTVGSIRALSFVRVRGMHLFFFFQLCSTIHQKMCSKVKNNASSSV